MASLHVRMIIDEYATNARKKSLRKKQEQALGSAIVLAHGSNPSIGLGGLANI